MQASRLRERRRSPDGAQFNGRNAMTGRVDGKVVLVTGAASGIGRGAAIVLAREGAKIAATDLQDEKGEGLVRQLADDGCDAAYFHHDVTREDDWRDIVAK